MTATGAVDAWRCTSATREYTSHSKRRHRRRPRQWHCRSLIQAPTSPTCDRKDNPSTNGNSRDRSHDRTCHTSSACWTSLYYMCHTSRVHLRPLASTPQCLHRSAAYFTTSLLLWGGGAWPVALIDGIKGNANTHRQSDVNIQGQTCFAVKMTWKIR